MSTVCFIIPVFRNVIGKNAAVLRTQRCFHELLIEKSGQMKGPRL